ncbi:hypothetical protein COO91_10452 (plasmid) [Nostoc flagelliforme CCNUN1]|uniref:Uncharacterized protein n=1 Tax=Nostoc flagelliforme CCNUN1 TaxID=2038116 RepID=A0A2K8T998_9NOSO|nr:hypothetical protein COO91_10452 [Nostoc flagelliforme CCNUN1]
MLCSDISAIIKAPATPISATVLRSVAILRFDLLTGATSVSDGNLTFEEYACIFHLIIK